MSARCNCRFHCEPNCTAFNRQNIPHSLKLFVAKTFKTVHAAMRRSYGKRSRNDAADHARHRDAVIAAAALASRSRPWRSITRGLSSGRT
jgi:hypothetical protein